MGTLFRLGSLLVILLLVVAVGVGSAQERGPSQVQNGTPTTATASAKEQGASPSGLERLSDEWPKWLKVGVLYRGRAESARPLTTAGAKTDSYYLNRFRLSATAKTASWFQGTVQVQDAQVLHYAVSPAPKSMANSLDLRQAYVEIGRRTPRGAVVSLGRQELTLGDGRLLASPDWGNVSRTYDLGRVSAAVPGFKLDAFGGGPVDVAPTGFHRVKAGERFYGAYASLDRLKRLGVVDGYFVGKANHMVSDELGGKGDGRLYTIGARAAGLIRKTVGWSTETAVQRGHQAADDVSAWATANSLSWTIGRSAIKPRITFEYDYSSGDRNPGDGVKGTFDQLYASNHTKYGLGDQIGWRNMEAFQVKAEFSPTRRLKVNGAVARLFLATVADAWYGSSGSKVVLNRAATSRDLGWETDAYITYTVSKELSLGTGLAYLRGGPYLRQSTPSTEVWYPYIMWTVKF